ncbi:ABC transporter permease [Streptomyces clavuligerus]|uniref:ABC transporter permease n=4 Tax=Streptomyces clavuligerus TaxID=1901 RepID=UPI00017FF55F|nr:ABC transporter permease [Streptomyces clavuligerus]ANW18274.1 ABC transporter [Streptomyces clavuligerus]AXU12837.1 ABC transporter permease [Streptomyces clavuligerus]EDY48463.1 oligopeptide transport system permease protein oppC [Streptomyces clavuligerus]MBY6302752.1 ABC transporter permease [Streptomyces clavuligerus]QCS05621.1 ABC transporter permease [Streptomyces clavuligerus]
MLRGLGRRPSALISAGVLALLVLLALAAPLITALTGQDPYAYHDGLIDSARGGVPVGPLGGVSADHWLGVEPGTGRDLLARLLYGARISLLVAAGATLVQIAIGLAVGLAAGLGGPLLDSLLSRVGDVLVALPMLVVGIALTAVVPPDFPRPLLLVLLIGAFGWGGTARIVRAQTLSLRRRDFVAAARLSGNGPWRVARRELLPSLAAPVITYAAVLLPVNIVVEASLSFLGVGVKPPTPSWGQMLSTAQTWFRADPMYVLLPAGLLFVTVLAFTVLGEAVRTALDPREASRLAVGTRREKPASPESVASPASPAPVSPDPAPSPDPASPRKAPS